MSKKLIHTPEGVRDIYNGDIIKREAIIDKLKEVIKMYSFDRIQTPTFEYMSVFYKDISLRKSKELYKFFDSEGDMLALRPDFTPSIARAVSKYYKDDKNVRLYYEGNVFINSKRYQGRLKEINQFGGELIGDNSICADAEIISIVVNSLVMCGLEDFQISIGHANIFKGLIDEANFNSDEIEELSLLMGNKNIYGLEDMLQSKNIDGDLKDLFILICKMYKPESKDFEELLEKAKKVSKVYESLKYLSDLYEILKLYDVEKYICFETDSVSNFDYYTGIIFSGYSYGSGETIVSGGRYDNLLSNFGKPKAAIGFAILVDQLQAALDKQNNNVEESNTKTIIVFTEEARNEAIKKARDLRNEGTSCELVLTDNIANTSECYKNDEVTIVEVTNGR